MGLPGGSVVKNPPANAGDEGLIPGLGRSHGEGNGNLLPTCQENTMDRGLQSMGLEIIRRWLKATECTHTHTHIQIIAFVQFLSNIYFYGNGKSGPSDFSFILRYF